MISARIVVTRGKKILMGFEPPRRDGLKGNHWECPGGKLESGETILECLKREMKEEIGTTVNIKDKMPFFFNTEIKRASGNLRGLMVYFICTLNGKPDLSKAVDNEFSELKYLGKSEFLSLSRKGKIMGYDRKNVPELMRKLKLW